MNLQQLSDEELIELYHKNEQILTEFNIKQSTIKVCANSLYGSIGNEFFRLFDIRIAEAITLSGQLTIKWVEKKINKFLNSEFNTKDIDYVLLSDTDSITVNLENYVKSLNTSDKKYILDSLDQYASNTIQKQLDSIFNELADITNAYENKMFMKRENICDKVVCIAKKNYIMNVWDSEGGVRFEKPKLKIMGFSGKKTNIPEMCRIALKECVDIIMNGKEEDIHIFIDNFKKKFYNSSFIEVASTSSCKGVLEYHCKKNIYRKGTPIATRAALLYNNYLENLELHNRYEKITINDKVKYCYMKVPNILNEDVFGVLKELPPEMEMENFIDYHKQFDKTFTEPLNKITKIIGWSHKEEINLLDF